MKRWLESIVKGPRDQRMLDDCVARNVRFLGHGRPPEPHVEFESLRDEPADNWRNVAFRQSEGDTEKWFFDLYTYVAVGLDRLGGVNFGYEPGGVAPSHYIGAISTTDRSWPRFSISDKRASHRVAEWLGMDNHVATGVPHFDNRFRVFASHAGFTRTLLDDRIQSVLLRLPKGCVVEAVGAHVLFLAPAENKLPFAIEPILDEFERKVPLAIDAWPGE